MRKLVLSMFAVFAMTTAMAQSEKSSDKACNCKKNDPKEMIQQRTDQMVKQYGLNADQATKLQALNEKYMKAPQMKEGDRPEPPKDMMDGERPEPPKDSIDGGHGHGPKGGHHGGRHGGPRGPHFDMKAYNADLKTIMTDDQYKQYESDMAKMREQHKGDHKGKKDKE